MNTLNDLFVDELQDIYDAEIRLSKRLPKLAEKARDKELGEAFREQTEETKEHIDRLKHVFEICDISEKRVDCEAMQGLLDETEELVNGSTDDAVRDAAMITAAQKIKHYEIASYGSLAEIAQTLGNDKVAKLLHDSLEQEVSADKKLTHLAVHGINKNASGEFAKAAV